MRQIELFLKNIYGNRFSGEFLSNQKGDGYDLEDFKEYQIGNSIKRINWKLSAKLGKEYVSVYKQEKDPIVDIFFDINTNMELFINNITTFMTLLDNLFSNLGIKKNIYTFQQKGFFKKKLQVKQYNNFNKINLYSKNNSVVNEIITSDIFRNNHYKIILSDFMFLKESNLKNKYLNKTFMAVLPILDVIENDNYSTTNGYYHKSINTQLIYNYKHILKQLSKLSKIENI